MRSYSLRKRGLVLFLLMASVVVMLFGACSAYMLYSYRKDYIATNQLVADHYAGQLNKDWDMLCNYVDQFSISNVHLQRLKQNKLSEFDQIGEEYDLQNALESKAASLNFSGILFYYDNQNEILRSAYSEDVSTGTGKTYPINQKLRAVLQDMDLDQEPYQNTWIILLEKSYLLHTFGNNHHYVGFLINLDQYLEDAVEDTEQEMQLLITDRDETCVASCGDLTDQEESNKLFSRYITVGVDLNMLEMKLQIIRPFWERGELWNNKTLWLFVILIPIIVMVFFRIIYRQFDRIMVEPVEYLLYRIQQMEKKEQESSVVKEKEHEPIKEFREIHTKLDAMLDRIRQLQSEKYEKELEAQDAQLQYYKLQINPHFFLNCMSLLDAMLEKTDVVTMRAFLSSLSHHFRYIFKNQADLVNLQEELMEVQAYVNLFSISRQEPVLFQTESTEALDEITVPILSVQTFVENSIKYAKIPGKILSLKVVVTQLMDEEGNFICIKISDNGNGYREEVLKELNKPYAGFVCHSHHVGIDNIKYRLHQFGGDKIKIVFYNDTLGGAVTEILLPREGLKHENSDY